MGWSCAWGAVRGKPPEVVLDELKLRRTGQACDFADPPISGGAIPGGWFIVAHGRREGPFFAEEVSRDCEVVEVNIVESAGYWSAAYWKNGEEVWRVTENHDEEDELSIEGAPPASLGDARRRFRDATAAALRGDDVDIDLLRNVPLVLAQEMTGFLHDRVPETDPPSHFEVLESLAPPPPPPPPPKKPWWKLW